MKERGIPDAVIENVERRPTVVDETDSEGAGTRDDFRSSQTSTCSVVSVISGFAMCPVCDLPRLRSMLCPVLSIYFEHAMHIPFKDPDM